MPFRMFELQGQASSLSPRASCPKMTLGLEAPETGWKPVLPPDFPKRARLVFVRAQAGEEVLVA